MHFFHLILDSTLRRKYCCFSHFTDEEIETCRASIFQIVNEVVEQDLSPGFAWFKACSLRLLYSSSLLVFPKTIPFTDINWSTFLQFISHLFGLEHPSLVFGLNKRHWNIPNLSIGIFQSLGNQKFGNVFPGKLPRVSFWLFSPFPCSISYHWQGRQATHLSRWCCEWRFSLHYL